MAPKRPARQLIRRLPTLLLAGFVLSWRLMFVLDPADGESLGPERTQTIRVTYEIVEWWLTSWEDDQVRCQVFVEHDRIPSGEEIFYACGDAEYEAWIETPACDQAGDPGTRSLCEGRYLHRVAATPAERELIVDLPEPTVWLSFHGCELNFDGRPCEAIPTLILRGEEPLPNEEILAVQGSLGGVPFYCEAQHCELPLRQTGPQGEILVFWSGSSFGDSSRHFTARVRVLPARAHRPQAEGWFVDILSSQWRGSPPLSCSFAWDALPPLGGLPDWLTTPETAAKLATDEPYALLAGLLIRNGAAPEAYDCPGFGLLENGAANACGIESARDAVVAWQNRFDVRILEVAQATDVPAQLLKNLFAQESQFWPGLHDLADEIGLGHLTEDGTDTTLLWNPSFYQSFCPFVLAESVCEQGYAQLNQDAQLMLRAALLNSVDARCPNCPLGLDLSRVDLSVEVFAETLQAHCDQVGRILLNTTGEAAGHVAGYVDLWRFSLANYHAGPGCLADAVSTAYLLDEPLDWAHVAPHFTPACESASDYVQRITLEPPAR